MAMAGKLQGNFLPKVVSWQKRARNPTLGTSQMPAPASSTKTPDKFSISMDDAEQ
jgi:hypothetical protein